MQHYREILKSIINDEINRENIRIYSTDEKTIHIYHAYQSYVDWHDKCVQEKINELSEQDNNIKEKRKLFAQTTMIIPNIWLSAAMAIYLGKETNTHNWIKTTLRCRYNDNNKSTFLIKVYKKIMQHVNNEQYKQK